MKIPVKNDKIVTKTYGIINDLIPRNNRLFIFPCAFIKIYPVSNIPTTRLIIYTPLLLEIYPKQYGVLKRKYKGMHNRISFLVILMFNRFSSPIYYTHKLLSILVNNH